MKWGEGNTSEFKKKKASGMMPNDFPTIDVKDETHQTMMEIEPLLIALGYRTRRLSCWLMGSTWKPINLSC